jgi:hypothetical protein
MKRIDIHLNKNQDVCDDLQCESEYAILEVYKNRIHVFHQYPLTPWKSNTDDIMLLDRESALSLAEALIEAANQALVEEQGYKEV